MGSAVVNSVSPRRERLAVLFAPNFFASRPWFVVPGFQRGCRLLPSGACADSYVHLLQEADAYYFFNPAPPAPLQPNAPKGEVLIPPRSSEGDKGRSRSPAARKEKTAKDKKPAKEKKKKDKTESKKEKKSRPKEELHPGHRPPPVVKEEARGGGKTPLLSKSSGRSTTTRSGVSLSPQRNGTAAWAGVRALCPEGDIWSLPCDLVRQLDRPLREALRCLPLLGAGPGLSLLTVESGTLQGIQVVWPPKSSLRIPRRRKRNKGKKHRERQEQRRLGRR